MLTYTDTERNAELAPIQWGYTPEGFYARQILPVVTVTNPSGQYRKFTAAHLRYQKSASDGGTKAPSVDMGLSYADYKCIDHSRSGFVPDKVSRGQGNAAALPIMQMTQDSLLVEEERDLAAAMNTTANFAYSNYLTPAITWNSTGADPWGGATTSVSAALTYLYGYNGGRRKDIIMWVTPDVDLVLADFARASIGNSGFDMPDEATMAKYFKVGRYVVLDSVYNSALPGQTDTLAGCFGTKQCWFTNSPANNNLLVPSFGKTIVDTGGSRVDQQALINPKGDELVLTNSYDQETIDWHQIYWIKDCLT